MRWQGDIDQFVTSFLDASGESTPLEQALNSIPQERWWAVWGRIVVGLDNEIVKLLPSLEDHTPAPGSVLSDDDDEVVSTIELKEKLLHQEGRRRLSA